MGCINHLLTYLVVTYFLTYLPTYVWDLVLTKLIIKVKPNITAVEVHPRLSNNEHPVDGALVSAGGVKFLTQQTRQGTSTFIISLVCPVLFSITCLLSSPKQNDCHAIGAFKSQTSKGKISEKFGSHAWLATSHTSPPSLRFSEWPVILDPYPTTFSPTFFPCFEYSIFKYWEIGIASH
jgi:hypothetical protein